MHKSLIDGTSQQHTVVTQATHLTNTASLSQDGSSDRSRQNMGHLSSIYCAHTSNTSNSTNNHKMGHLIGAAKRWDISAAYCAHTGNTSNSTNTAYHKIGHLIGAAKIWGISAAYCAHTSNTSNSTNKHSLSQDGSSDRSCQNMWHLSSILCSHKQHI